MKNLLLILFLLTNLNLVSAQKSTNYKLFFTKHTEVVIQEGYEYRILWQGTGEFNFKIWLDEEPLTYIIATKETRSNLTIYPIEGVKEAPLHIFGYQDTELDGTFISNQPYFNPDLMPTEGKDNKAVLLLILGLLVFL